MVAVGRLQTQTEGFWRDQYAVSEGDMDLVTSLMLEAGKPQGARVLAEAIVKRRFEADRETSKRQAEARRLYQPKAQYGVGDELVFSSQGFKSGRVVAVRSGNNPRYGPFGVIRVQIADENVEREFAAGFDHPHPLNRSPEELLGSEDPSVSAEDLVRMYTDVVAERVEAALRAHGEYVPFNNAWFLRELLPEVHVGHLNLAEAMIYEATRPLLAQDMVKDLDLGGSGSSDAVLFALNHALGQDRRFDNVGTVAAPMWYLRALEPEAVHHRPAVHSVGYRASGGEYLGITMLDLVEEISDELDDAQTALAPSTTGNGPEGMHCELVFPHLSAGTLPLTARFCASLTSNGAHHFPITLVDGEAGQRFEAWAVPSEGYLCGLGDWFSSVGMCAGGEISVTPTKEAMVYIIGATRVRSRRSEWVRSAAANEGKLVLQMQRAAVAVRCDRNMLIDVPDRQGIVKLMATNDSRQLSIASVVRVAFEEMAKLSGRGVVHAKSIYAAANLLRRTGAVPVFAELTRRACYVPLAEGLWAYESAQEGNVYRTPEEMYDRPLATRVDVIKDQVVRYLGR